MTRGVSALPALRAGFALGTRFAFVSGGVVCLFILRESVSGQEKKGQGDEKSEGKKALHGVYRNPGGLAVRGICPADACACSWVAGDDRGAPNYRLSPDSRLEVVSGVVLFHALHGRW